MPALRRYRLTLSLAAVNLLLIAAVASELWLRTQSEEESEASSAAAAGKQDVHVVPKFDFRLLPVTSYREIVERSLFVSTRQAGVLDELVAGEGRQSEGPPPFVLVGTIILPSTRVALLRQATGTRVLRVPEGKDASGGWRVAKVDRDSVLLRRGGQSQELKLKKSQKKPESAKKSESAVVTPPVPPASPPAHGGSPSPPAQGEASAP
jgi:hypothetical protein